MAVGELGLHAAQHIELLRPDAVVEHLVVRKRVTHVIGPHRHFVAVVETAVGQHDHRLGRRIVRVAVQIGIHFADRRVAGGPIGIGRIGLLVHPVLGIGLHVAQSSDEAILQPLDDLIVQLALQPQVGYVDVNAVVLQLVEDIERSVVQRRILQVAVLVVRTQRAARVERIAERVDIEIAVVLAGHDVGLTAERTGSILTAVHSVDGEGGRHLLADRVVVAERHRVAVHLIVGHRPARIVHEAYRSIGLRLLRTGRDADAVVLDQRIAEQQVEPIRIGESIFIKECLAGIFRIFQTELTIIGMNQIPHDAVHTGRRLIDDLRGEQPLAFHFGIDGHLVERVHDIVLIVRGLRADPEVAVVADDRLAELRTLAPLGRDDDHAVHRAGAVHGRSGGILQNVERLDVLGIDARHRRAQQRRRVAARELVVRHVHHILQHHAVDDPQRLVVTGDRRDAANTHLGRSTERTRHVLHRYAGRLAFQHTADVRRTGHVQVGRVQLDRRTGKGLLLEVLITGDDDLVDIYG